MEKGRAEETVQEREDEDRSKKETRDKTKGEGTERVGGGAGARRPEDGTGRGGETEEEVRS